MVGVDRLGDFCQEHCIAVAAARQSGRVPLPIGDNDIDDARRTDFRVGSSTSKIQAQFG